MVRRMALVVLASGLVACGGTGTSSSAPTSAPPSTAATATRSPSSEPTPTEEPSPNVVASVPTPGAVLSAFDSIWVQERQEGSIWRLDRRGRVLEKIPHAVRAIEHFGVDTFTLAAGYGSVWGLTDGAVVRIDPDTDRTVARIPVPAHAFAIAVGREGVWVSCCSNGLPNLIRIDPDTNDAHVVREMQVSPSSFAVGNGFVWWGDFSEAGAMQRFDPATGQEVRIEAANMRFIVPTPRWTWLIAADGSTQRVAAASVQPATDAGRKAPLAIGATEAGGTVWINAGDVIGFDASTGKIEHRIALGTVRYQASGGIAVLGERVWVAQPARDQVIGVPIG
jgi:hypothetical protein